MKTRMIVVMVVLAVAACDPPGRALPAVHFANAPAVTIVDDRRDVPVKPEVRIALPLVDFYDRAVIEQLTWPLSVPKPQRALGVNALDEVPDSTWFTNRIGVHELTPDEVRAGPGGDDDDGPEAHVPWTIRSTKPGGAELGFVINDARGVKYLVKFDDADAPEVETGAHIVTNRLLWACGYNVADDRIAYVRAEDLVLSPKAAIKDNLGRDKQRLDHYTVAKRLATAWRTKDGRYRVMVSRWIEGASIGGAPNVGVRRGDSNDRIPHERRRDLRGQYTIFAWLDHVDLNSGNFPDFWIEDPRDPRKHFVMHYKVDFGKSLRAMASLTHYPQEGYAYSIDYASVGLSIITLGIAPRPWGHAFAPKLVGVAPTFVAGDFDPGEWHPDTPYRPFEAADRFDKAWGARIVARFTRAQIRAAVEAARYSDPRAVDYITDVLVARQRAVVAYWFARVNPLAAFAARDGGVCFEDLAIAHGLAAADTRYEATSFDARMRPLGHVAFGAGTGGATCSPALVGSLAADGYTVVRIATVRPDVRGETYVHLARDPSSGAWRVIGVWRT